MSPSFRPAPRIRAHSGSADASRASSVDSLKEVEAPSAKPSTRRTAPMRLPAVARRDLVGSDRAFRPSARSDPTRKASRVNGR
jgi:hypothetical protein